ncbi:hypothetical protein L0F63_005243 [Massospora cicadina]|nr:hypothetical protein L0F63_005243 [Massospora cicadina]
MSKRNIRVLSWEDSKVIFSMGRMNTLHQTVCELVENSYDSGPTQIGIFIALRPQIGVEVLDDGTGISPNDFPLVGTLNATSKGLAKAQDPHWIDGSDYSKNPLYLGSKGEALYCLSTIANLSVTSRNEPFSAALTAILKVFMGAV